MSHFFMPSAVFVLGLLVGSFLNVCIHRIPLGDSFVTGRSRCPSCQCLIPWCLNIPLLSFLLLRGRCHVCGQKISLRYPAVELLNAGLYLVIYGRYGFTVTTVLLAALASILVVISFIDISHQIIPDGLVIAIALLSIVNLLYQTLLLQAAWHTLVVGFFAASVPLFILGLIFPDGIGGGDIKLMAAGGLYLGWQMILFALFLGSLYAGFFACFILWSRKGTLKTAIPFGPALAIGILTCALAGDDLLFWYLSLFA